jgi:PASTA domain
MSRRGFRIAFLAAVGVIALGATSAPAASLSEGGMSFQAITSVAGPEDFSWTVNLGDDQELKAIDDQSVGVFYEDGHPAFTLHAVKARDAVGTKVPTTIAVSGPDMITLTVHHRAGNPLAGGAPFVYPVVAGAGWEGGLQTYIVQMPPGEFPPPKTCLVPRLKGKTLKAAKRLLAAANCSLGRLKKLKTIAKAGRVVGQSLAPGIQLPEGTAVRITLGER